MRLSMWNEQSKQWNLCGAVFPAQIDSGEWHQQCSYHWKREISQGELGQFRRSITSSCGIGKEALCSILLQLCSGDDYVFIWSMVYRSRDRHLESLVQFII